VRIEYCSKKFAGSVLVCNNGISKLLDASGIDMWINGARATWIELLGSLRHNFIAHKSTAAVGSDETL
jgi:hypothetical protein